MKSEEKQSLFRELQKQIKMFDPEEEIVQSITAEDDTFSIKYSGIKIEDELRGTLEDVATALLVVQLIKKYGFPKQNIVLEKKRETARTATYFDMYVEKPEEKYSAQKSVGLFVETKIGPLSEKQIIKFVSDQLIEPAYSFAGHPQRPYPKYLIFYEVYLVLDRIVEKLKTIDYEAFMQLPEPQRSDIKGILENPYITVERIPLYTDPWLGTYAQTLRKNTSFDLRPFVDLQELVKIIAEVKDVIWRGKLKTERAFKFIMRLLLAKLYDEEATKEGEEYHLQIKPDDETRLDEFVTRINRRFQSALHNLLNIPWDDAVKDDILVVEYERGGPIKIEAAVLFESVRKIHPFRFKARENTVDILGEFFERFLWSEYKQEKGQFFTHPNLVRFTIQMLSLPNKFIDQLNEGAFPYVLDPACGSGTFLVETMKQIQSIGKQNEKLQEISRRRHWACELLYGIDVERDLVLCAKVNMIMHGDGSGSIVEADSLADLEQIPVTALLGKENIKTHTGDWAKVMRKGFERFSFILTNPPFSLPLSQVDAERLCRNFVLADVYRKQTQGTSKSSEIFFAERWYQFLKENGEVGAVLPESAFDTLEYLPFRLFILFRFRINAIVSLPEHAFAPFAAQRTNLFFATKRPKEETLSLLKTWDKLLSLAMERNKEEAAIIKEIEQFESRILSQEEQERILIAKNTTDSPEACAWLWLLGLKPGENYHFFVALAENIGYFRTKKAYWETPLNDLSQIAKAYEEWIRGSLPNSRKVKIARIEEIADSADLRTDVKFLQRNKEGKPFLDLFELVEGRRPFERNIEDWLSTMPEEKTIKYIETGNITSRGEISYVEIPIKDLTKEAEAELLDADKETTTANYIRMIQKIKSGKIVAVAPDVIVMAPARPYQAKIAYIDGFFASGFYYSPDFIILRTREPLNPKSGFLLLHEKQVTAELNKVARIGKGGYPKLREEDLKFVRIPEKLIERANNPERIALIEEVIRKRRELFEITSRVNSQGI